jgi:hypothetical protein
MQFMPESTPFLLQVLQWTVAGLKGSSTIEGVLDQAVAEAQKTVKQKQAAAMARPTQPPPPDPKILAAQIKAKAELGKVQVQHVADMEQAGAEAHAQMVVDEHKAQVDTAVDSVRQQERQEQVAGLRATQGLIAPLLGQ